MSTSFTRLTLESLKTSAGIRVLNEILEKLSRITAGDGEGVRVFDGFGSPEDETVASIGSIYLRKDGSSGTSAYVKEEGTGATGWTPMSVPVGTIVLWYGAVADIPTGWVLCDGDNDTPDLTDKFVVGAGDTYDPDDTGGESTHTLTTSEMPAHVHTATTYYLAGTPDARFSGDSSNNPYGSTSVDSTGGDGAHENKPPYHALCYIMKT